jgi:hypothetical protein
MNPHTGNPQSWKPSVPSFSEHVPAELHGVCPEGLYKYWMGHAGRDKSDLYDKVKEDAGFRRKWAERCEFGFELPSVVPNVPKIVPKSASGKAA